MNIEHMTINGSEITAFDFPADTQPPCMGNEYRVYVDGLGVITVEKGYAPKPLEWVALATSKIGASV